MGILTIIKNALVIVFLVVGVYFIANFAGPVKNEVMGMLNMPGSSVKGASTKKAERLSDKLGSDINAQLANVEQQFLQLTVMDALNGIARLQRVPQDVRSVSDYTREQIDNMLQSSDQKRKAKEKKESWKN